MDEPRIPDDLRDAWTALRPEDHARTVPPASVWDAIAAELEAEPAAGERGEGSSGTATVTKLRFGGVRPVAWLAAAAAVVAVALGVSTLLSTGSAVVVAEVAITSEGLPLQAPDAATARLVSDDAGYHLELDLPELPEADGAYEVWIIDAAVTDMYSLGILDGSGSFDLPDGVEPAAFPIIDISVEPDDGDPTHSGQSIWRGELQI